MEQCTNCGAEFSGKFCAECGTAKSTVAVENIMPPQGRETISVHALAGESKIQEIGEGRITSGAAKVFAGDDEEMVWQESPSPLLMAGLVIKYSIFLFLIALLSLASRSTGWLVMWTFVAGIHLTIRFLQLRSIKYLLSSQRLQITSGLLKQVTIAYEVHYMGEALIESPLLLRVFGRSNLNVSHRGGVVTLFAIQQAEGVRDMIRNAGVIEGSRFDKMRVR